MTARKISVSACEEQKLDHGGFAFTRKRLGAAAGGQKLGTSWSPLRFLALSTMIEPEVAVYPDSKKLGVLARAHGLASVHKQDTAVDYYEGEE